MQLINAFIHNPVKVSVGVLLVVMFGLIALYRMPMQLSPDVQRPTISIRTRWPGASPQEIEKEIVQEQEEQLKSVEGITKMSSECSDSSGSITLEFAVGTNMQEAILKVNTQLQQVRDYPIDADEPTIRTSDSSSRAIAWFILSARPASDEQILEFGQTHPQWADELRGITEAHNQGLKVFRLKEFASQHPEAASLLPPDLQVTKYRKFAQDQIESRFERVSGVSDANVMGGEEPEVQVLVDPKKLAGRGLTIMDVRQALTEENRDTSAGDFWEGKRRYVVRTLGQYTSLDQVRNQIIYRAGGQPVYIADVADVLLSSKKPDGFVRRYGVANIAINCERDSGANVIAVMKGLRKTVQQLNDGILKREGLILTQVYDETDYINSAIGLVDQNIIVGGTLTIIVLMLFLHMSLRTLVFVPILAASAAAAVLISAWFFLLTLAIVLLVGFWFARGTLVVGLAIPTSIIGTFLVLNLLGRSLNVISLAGLAFAVGMLVDNAVVVLENVYRYWQMGYGRFEAAKLAAAEVWGAVLASTLTTLAVFLPIIFLEGEAGQLFVDIALAISAAVGLSLLVSVIVIPTAAARLLQETHQPADERARAGGVQRLLTGFGRGFTNLVIGINRWIQRSTVRRVAVVLLMFAGAIGVGRLLMPKIEYLPTGNRNLVISLVLPPPGYNVQQLGSMGKAVEETLRPYWDVDADDPASLPSDFPAIGDFFYVARGSSVFIGLRALNASEASKLIDLLQTKLQDKFPGSFVTAFQTSLFGRGLSGGRTIDVEISGPELKPLTEIGKVVMGKTMQVLPQGTQVRPESSLELASPELHVHKKAHQAVDLGVTSTELGYTVNALIDGAYATDYFQDGEKIDLVIRGSDHYSANTQDLEAQYVATRNMAEPVRLDAVAEVSLGAGPEQINRRERQRAVTIQVTPPPELSLEDAIEQINTQVIADPMVAQMLGSEYQIYLSGTADKLRQTWIALRFNLLLAVMITYLLMAALFESWLYPLVIILSVPMGAVGGILGLRLLGVYLSLRGVLPQALDVLTMLGFVILIGTVVNNAILIVHQSLNFMKLDHMEPRDAILESIRTRIRPIFMTTLTTVFGLSPLVFFPGAGSELYRGLGSVVLGGLFVSTIFTLFLVPTLFSLAMDGKQVVLSWFHPAPAAVPREPAPPRVREPDPVHV